MSADDQAWAATLQAQPWPLPPRRRAPAFSLQARQLAVRALRRAYRHPFLVALNFAAAAATAAGLAVTFYATGYETGGIQSRQAHPVCPSEVSLSSHSLLLSSHSLLRGCFC